MKAGKLVTGEASAETALRNGTAELVIIAADASENTRTKFVNKCFYYKRPVTVYGDRQALSNSVGKLNRTVFVITEQNMAKRLMEMMEVRIAEDTNS
jgi:ribosomal protein L7Ae-like RNA K-turn-binding protein